MIPEAAGERCPTKPAPEKGFCEMAEDLLLQDDNLVETWAGEAHFSYTSEGESSFPKVIYYIVTLH